MAADHFFQSLSPELMQHVFHACDNFLDLVALASTCKTIHAAWLSSAPTIIWVLAPTIIVAFDNALMAVRATKIVADAQRNSTRTLHPFSVRELSGNVKRPLPEEMKSVFAFQHLARCVEWMMFHQQAGNLMKLSRAKSSNYYGDRNEWIYRGIYNFLLAGAVSFQPYNAPFFQAAAEERVEFLERCAKGSPLTDNDFAYLKQFPVFNYRSEDDSDLGRWKDKEYEFLFDGFARWLIEDGARRGVREKLGRTRIPMEITDDGSTFEEDWDAGKSFDESKTGSIHEIKILIGAYEYFDCKVINSSHDEFINLRSRSRWNAAPGEIQEQREVTAVIFGDFQLVQISMPRIVEDSGGGFLFAKPCSEFPATGTIEVRTILEMVERHDKHSRDDYPPPPLKFDIFSFILKNYLDLKLKANTFDPESGYDNYLLVLSFGDIFRVPNYEDYQNDNLVMYRSPFLSDIINY